MIRFAAPLVLLLFCAGGIGAPTPELHVLLISVDGLHPVDVANYVRAKPNSALAALVASGVTFSDAMAPIPSDSYPGLIALITGGTPKTTGIYYDEFYDRALSPPGPRPSCTTVGTVVRFDKSIEIDPTAVDGGGGGIDPAKLPRDSKSSRRSSSTLPAISSRHAAERNTDPQIVRFMPYRKVRAFLEERFRMATGGAASPAVAAETAQPRLQLGRKRRQAPSRR